MYAHSSPQLSVCTMPKRFLEHKSCEVMRFYKLHNKGLVEPIQMIVPRKVCDCYCVVMFVWVRFLVSLDFISFKRMMHIFCCFFF